MSQAGANNIQGGGTSVVETLTGNSGGAVSPTANNINVVGAGSVSVAGNPGTSTLTINVQTAQSSAVSDVTKIGLAAFKSSQFSVDGNGFVSLSSSSIYISLSPYIVGPDVHSGFSTIAAAIAQAVADGASSSSPANIYIKPQSGGYTENPVLQDGINLIGFNEQTIITGKITYSGAGTSTITSLGLTTNSDYCISITGANQVTLRLFNCNIDAKNNTAINYTNSNITGILEFYNCTGFIDTTGIAFFSMSAKSPLRFFNCYIQNPGVSSTASTNSSTSVVDVSFYESVINFPITGSNSGIVLANNSQLQVGPYIINGTSQLDQFYNCFIDGGASSAISIGAGALAIISHCVINSTIAGNAITGSGTMKYAFLSFKNTSATNVTTQTALATLI